MNRKVNILVLLASLVVLGGCASFRDTYQTLPVACNTDTCIVENLSDKRKIQAPTFVQIEREGEVTLRYQYQNQIQEQKIQGHVRWLDSVLPNSLLTMLGPAGWAIAIAGISVDYFTGNIWDLPEPSVVHFNTTVEAPEVVRLVVAPVKADSQLESDEAVRIIVKELRSQYPQSHIEVPEENLKDFERSGWSYNGKPSKQWKLFELYAALKTPYVVMAEVENLLSGERLIKMDLRDVLRRKTLAQSEVRYTSIYINKETEVWAKSKVVELVPNSLSLQHSNSSSFGFGFKENQDVAWNSTSPVYEYYTLSGNKAKHEGTKEWGISFANLEQDMGRRFAFLFKWATEANIRKNSLYVHKTAISSSYNSMTQNFDTSVNNSIEAGIDQYFLGGAIGPEVGLVGPFGYLYLNILYGAELLYADISTGKQVTEVYSPLKMGLGYKISLTDSLQLGAELQYRNTPSWVADKILRTTTGQDIASAAVTEIRILLGMTFYLPEMKSYARKKARSLVDK